MTVTGPCKTAQGNILVADGRITGSNMNGTVKANGSVFFVSSQGTGSGQLAARSGSGSFQRSDGCSFSWTASKL